MALRPRLGFWAAVCVVLCAGLLAGCSGYGIPKELKPVPRSLLISMQEQGMDEKAPILIRIFKEENQLEVWKQKRNGEYAFLKSYDICRWSGELGPKKVEGDKQAPEGFYTVTPAQMNPNSDYYLSFNIGYPNAYDRSLGRTGGNLMVHGACSSAGCYSMTDASAGEIFALARDAFAGGQRQFQIQAFPFRMTPENMAKHYDNPNMDFWRMLKVGYDNFELTHVPPKVDVCGRQYVFNADAGGQRFDPYGRCPAYTVPEPLGTAVAQKQAADEAKFASVVAVMKASGQPPAPTTQVAASGPAPSLLNRIGIGNAGSTPAPATVAAPAVAQANAPASSVPGSAAAALAAAPVPAPKAARGAALASTGAVVKPTLAPQTTPGSAGDPIGTLIDRKFWWDDAPARPGA